MPYALPPAPPAIVQQVATTRQRVTDVAPVSMPITVPAYARAARDRGWPFTTTRADANAVSRAVLDTVLADGVRVTRVQVRQDVARSNLVWWVTTNAPRAYAGYRSMSVRLNRNGRGTLWTSNPVPVVCCQADPTRAHAVQVKAGKGKRKPATLRPRKRSWSVIVTL